jgi:hypothetical protein
MRRFYESALWITQSFFSRNPDFHHGLLAHTDAITNEDDRRLMIAIQSETDHLPIGGVRKLWAPDALQRKEPEIAGAEALWKAEFLEACKRIADTVENS